MTTNWYKVGYDEGSAMGSGYLPPINLPGGVKRAQADYHRGFNDARRLHGQPEVAA